MSVADDATWALEELARRRSTYALRWAYYDGFHRLAFASERWRTAFGDLFRSFAENLCQVVVDTMVDRLEIHGWKDADEVPQDAAVELWRSQPMSRVAGEVHLEAAVAGDSYLLVWPARPPAFGPVFWPQPAHTMVVRYGASSPFEVELAAKAWLERTRVEGRMVERARLTLYYPDRLERYATRGRSPLGIPVRFDAFVPHEDDDGPAIVPNAFGVVPVFHFANATGPGRPGRSELSQVIPLNDALNKAVLDALVAAEFHALQQRWATGLELEIDPLTGKPKQPEAGADVLWTNPDPDGRFGSIEGGDLTGLLALADRFVMAIARVSSTPAHRFLLGSGQWPSGESLKTAEAPLVAKVKDRQDGWAWPWGAAMGLGLRMAGLPPDAPLLPVWGPAHSRSEREEAEVGEIRARSVSSRREELRRMGYDEDEVERIVREAEEEAAGAVDRGAVV